MEMTIGWMAFLQQGLWLGGGSSSVVVMLSMKCKFTQREDLSDETTRGLPIDNGVLSFWQ